MTTSSRRRMIRTRMTTPHPWTVTPWARPRSPPTSQWPNARSAKTPCPPDRCFRHPKSFVCPKRRRFPVEGMMTTMTNIIIGRHTSTMESMLRLATNQAARGRATATDTPHRTLTPLTWLLVPAWCCESHPLTAAIPSKNPSCWIQRPRDMPLLLAMPTLPSVMTYRRQVLWIPLSSESAAISDNMATTMKERLQVTRKAS
mmetsp:Transcript_13065/g.36065  ORF Transcript_13065/g.36065 Transcript_13065/m.36065 type:complete len:201 (+) Transcript_13065:287-889(+)